MVQQTIVKQIIEAVDEAVMMPLLEEKNQYSQCNSPGSHGIPSQNLQKHLQSNVE